MDYLIFFMSSCFVALMWFAWCNYMTFKQRMEIYAVIWHDMSDIKYKIRDEWIAVDYNWHLSSLFFFKNPYKLYGPLIRAEFVK